jgi:hypothetical protein
MSKKTACFMKKKERKMKAFRSDGREEKDFATSNENV